MDATLVARWLATAVLLPGLAAIDPANAPADSEQTSALTERIKVTATRLPEEAGAVETERVPAHVTTILADEIERSGATTLQDLLAFEAGVVVYDQVGNDIEKTLDLRGFAGGSGTRVFLDGAPLNDTRNNALFLDLVPLAALDRIEITRGSAAALAGGGAEAGVIQLVTRRGDKSAGSLSVAGGSFDARRFGGELSGRVGAVDYFLSGSRDSTGGFRENADGDLRRLAGTVGLDLGGERRLALSLADARSDLGNPGALTPDEFASDPSESPYNSLDFAERTLDQASLNYSGPLAESWSLAANGFLRDGGAEILSSGRAAATFGGFFLDSDERAVGSTIQLTRVQRPARPQGALTLGLEWLDGETDAAGFSTPSGDPGQVDRENPDSENTAHRRTLAAFIQESWHPLPRWSFTAGARLDRDRIGYEERLPDPANRDSRDFSEVSLRAGSSWNVTPKLGVYASYGEAFLPPTAEQLFSFPTFGSNPELRPEDSRSYEVGFRGRWKRQHALRVALFLIDTDDEIIFDPDSPLGMFGANVNAGRTRREGAEVAYHGEASERLALFASLTLIDAEFRNGPERGNRVPLVPGARAAAGFELRLPAGIALRADGMVVGEQVLDNDDANAQQRLASYVVANTRLAWTVPHRGRERDQAQSEGRGPVLFAEIRNLFDRDYATRGIYAFDFAALQNQVFVTPAPGRRVLAGAEWRF